jgi:hypothetical protein
MVIMVVIGVGCLELGRRRLAEGDLRQVVRDLSQRERPLGLRVVLVRYFFS